MISVCVAIVIIVAITGFMMMRSGSKRFAVAVIPLGFVPLAHLLGTALERIIDYSLSPLELVLICVGFDIAALVFACLMLGMTARKIKKSFTRKLFLISCGLFEVVLAFALIADVVKPVINELVQLHAE